MNENEYLTVNDRYYVNPQLSVDESEQFLETLRNAQKQGNAQIAQETHALGTDVPSSMGGLSGSGGIWEQRYQNPRVDSAVAKLRASMQADALSKTMGNILSQKQQEYKDAYRKAYKKKENSNNPSGTNPDGEGEDPEFKSNDSTVKTTGMTGRAGYYTIPDMATGEIIDIDMETGKKTTRGKESYHSPSMAAGMSELSDLVTGMYNYTLPGNIEFEEGGTAEELRELNGRYYVWNKNDNTYTPVIGDEGRTPGGSRWWKKGN